MVLLLAVPLLGIVAAATILTTITPTGSQRATGTLGAAELLVTPGADSPQEIRGALPAGTSVEPLIRVPVALPGREEPVELLGVDLRGLAAGMLEVTTGRSVASDDEVGLSAELAGQLGLTVGDTVEIAGSQRRVVGILRDPTDLTREVVATLPTAVGEVPAGWLVDPSGDAASDPQVAGDGIQELGQDPTTAALTEAGWQVATRTELARADPEQQLLVLTFGGFVLLVAGLVTTAAFAVVAIERRHDLGLLAAAGAEPRHLRRSVLAQAMVIGVAAIGLGLTGGLALAAVALPWLEDWSNVAVDGLTIPTGIVAIGVALSMTTALGAALLSARAAGRTPVAAALTARRPPRTSGRTLLIGGVATALLGLGLVVATALNAGEEALTALGLLLGSGMVVVGVGATTPWLVEISSRRLGGRLPLAGRIALRDTARHRSRTAPVVVAIGAGLGLGLAATTVFASTAAGLASNYRPLIGTNQLLINGPTPQAVVTELAKQLPVDSAAPIRTVALGGDAGVPPAVTVTDPSLVAALGVDDADVDDLATGAILVFVDDAASPPTDELIHQAESIDPDRVRTVEIPSLPRVFQPVVLTSETFRAVGLLELRVGEQWIITLDRTVTDADGLLTAQVATTLGHTVRRETGAPDVEIGMIGTIATAGSGVLALLVVTGGLALLAAETRPDELVLQQVGATPGTVPSIIAWRAWLLTTLGAVVAIPAGILPTWGLARSVDAAQLAVPPLILLALLVFLPLLAAGFAWASAHLRGRRPRDLAPPAIAHP